MMLKKEIKTISQCKGINQMIYSPILSLYSQIHFYFVQPEYQKLELIILKYITSFHPLFLILIFLSICLDA